MTKVIMLYLCDIYLSFFKALIAPNEELYVKSIDSDEYDVHFECGISQPIMTKGYKYSRTFLSFSSDKFFQTDNT